MSFLDYIQNIPQFVGIHIALDRHCLYWKVYFVVYPFQFVFVDEHNAFSLRQYTLVLKFLHEDFLDQLLYDNIIFHQYTNFYKFRETFY